MKTWRQLCIAALATLWATSGPASAEFVVGTDLPEFTLATPDGGSVSVKRVGGALQLGKGEELKTPNMVAIHLLQPDCLQCRAQLVELKALHERFGGMGLLVLGISHRGSADDLRKLGADLGLTFPLLVGTGSDLAKQFAAGDAFGIADQGGKIQYAQVGFGKGDEALWMAAVEQIEAGKTVTKTTVDRERLAVGDRFPAVELPSLISGKPMALIGKDGALAFRDEGGVETKKKGAVGFFSRYWAFSREEMVHLQKFHERYADNGLQVFVIAMHPDPGQAKKITSDLKVSYPIFNGLESDLGKLYAFGWPAFIIDAGGVIRYTQVGFEQGDEKKYEKIIKEILGNGWAGGRGGRGSRSSDRGPR